MQHNIEKIKSTLKAAISVALEKHQDFHGKHHTPDGFSLNITYDEYAKDYHIECSFSNYYNMTVVSEIYTDGSDNFVDKIVNLDENVLQFVIEGFIENDWIEIDKSIYA